MTKEFQGADSGAFDTAFHVVIVGGGMVGSSLACMLAQQHQDWKIALIESQSLNVKSLQISPQIIPTRVSDAATTIADMKSGDLSNTPYPASFDARSTALARGSIEIFQQLGIWSQLRQHSTLIDKVHISDRGHVGGSLICGQDYPAIHAGATATNESDRVNAVGAVIENAWFGKVLLQQLKCYKNITCIAPASVERLQAKKGGYLLQVSITEPSLRTLTISTELCIVCDGAQSKLRKSLGINVDCVDYQQQAIIANVEFSASHQGIAYERFTAAGPMALLPLGESASAKKAALVWTLPNSECDAVLGLDDEAFLQTLQQRFGTRLGRFVRMGQRHHYPLTLLRACEQVRSHLVLMGNSAHFLHPVAGQGFNLALRDCVALCDELQSQKCDELQRSCDKSMPIGSLAVLERYLKRQKFDQQATIKLSDSMVKFFSTSALPQTVFRSLGFIGLELLPPAKKWLAQQTMGIG